MTPGNFGAEPTGLNDSFVNPTDPIRRVIRRGLMLFALAEDTSQLPVLISGTAREPCHGVKRREVECVPGPSWSELPYPTGSYKTALVKAGIPPGLTQQPGLSCKNDEKPLPERKTSMSGVNESVLRVIFCLLLLCS